jgi:hypothetical protein
LFLVSSNALFTECCWSRCTWDVLVDVVVVVDVFISSFSLLCSFVDMYNHNDQHLYKSWYLMVLNTFKDRNIIELGKNVISRVTWPN